MWKPFKIYQHLGRDQLHFFKCLESVFIPEGVNSHFQTSMNIYYQVCDSYHSVVAQMHIFSTSKKYSLKPLSKL